MRMFLVVFSRDFVVDKIAELLSKTKEPGQDDASSKPTSTSSSFKMVEPLMRVFREDVDLTSEAQKEIAWEKHFGIYGRGVTMFRTVETTEKILEGIPDKQVPLFDSRYSRYTLQPLLVTAVTPTKPNKIAMHPVQPAPFIRLREKSAF